MEKTLVIAMAATKGGVCKTSLVECFSAHAAKEGARVALIDLDPQCSLSHWWQLRGRPDNPHLAPARGSLADDVKRLRASGWQYILIDTPPGNVDIVVDAISVADVALVPTRVSIEDVLAVEPAVDACAAAGVPFAFVLTAYDPAWKISANSASHLATQGKVLAPPMRYRAAYASAKTLGKTGPESQDARQAKLCREEITALWSAVLELANG